MNNIEVGSNLIIKFEGFRAAAYADPIYGWKVPTIGYGTTIYPSGIKVKKGDTCTKEQALAYLQSYVEHKIIPSMEKIPTWKQMNVNQQAALISFGYNLGERFYKNANFKSITKLCDSPELWRDSDYIEAQFHKYRNPGSNVEKGLSRRRHEEAQLFLTLP